jgi:pyrimidine deaminase RibD-like protein
MANSFDLRMMNRAIKEAGRSSSPDPDDPKVGAVICQNGKLIATGFRTKQDHAEKNAIDSLKPGILRLTDSTLYTTLEPCTREVRSDPERCCTELIKQHRIKRVFIGILDPNQGVTGKGIWDLQESGIDVELFPPLLARQITVLNADFIRSQKSLGIKITSPKEGEKIKTTSTRGKYKEFSGTFVNTPGSDTFVLVHHQGRWYFQPYPLVPDEKTKTWKTAAHFGSLGPHTLYIVKANELGSILANFDRQVLDRHRKVTSLIDKRGNDDLKKEFPRDYPFISMTKLPKGLQMQDLVNFEVV